MPKTDDLPGVTGKGVAPLKIAELDKAIAKYQRKKETRCEATPDEIAAKKEVRDLLHEHRGELPVNGDGIPFYRCDDRLYLLEEKLKVRKVAGLDEDDEDED